MAPIFSRAIPTKGGGWGMTQETQDNQDISQDNQDISKELYAVPYQKKSKEDKKKTGKLSYVERTYIRQNVKLVSTAEMAERLNRNEEILIKFMDKDGISIDNITYSEEHKELICELHTRNYWSQTANQFTTLERQYFEGAWASLMAQFKSNVLYAEELHIKQLITLEILMNRSMAERTKHIQQSEKIQKRIDQEYKIDKDDRDKAAIANLEQQLAFMRNSIGSYTNEHTKLLKEQQNISKDLKATRDKRIERIDDSKTSFTAWIKSLEDEKIRERVGDHAEVMKLAKDKAVKDYSKYHTYIDGSVDIPFLNHETIDQHHNTYQDLLETLLKYPDEQRQKELPKNLNNITVRSLINYLEQEDENARSKNSRESENGHEEES